MKTHGLSVADASRINMKKTSILFLTTIAGFVDTAGFVKAGGIFPAHVTGNFVVFGASLSHGFEMSDLYKLCVFPVFMLAVALGAVIYGRIELKHGDRRGLSCLLFLQFILIAMVALLSVLMPEIRPEFLALILAVAMAFQNVLHRYMSGSMTTVMTGNVMHWAAAKAEILMKKPVTENLPKQKPFTGGMIAGFAAGCIAAGFLTREIGLASCIVPAIMLLIVIRFESLKAR